MHGMESEDTYLVIHVWHTLHTFCPTVLPNTYVNKDGIEATKIQIPFMYFIL